MARCRRWWGIDVGDRSANLWGHSRYIGRRPGDGLRKALSTTKARLLNRIVLSAYDLSDENMAGYWKRVEAFRPAFLIGYATSLYTFADFVARKRLPGAALGLKGIISTAEVLYDWQEAAIKSAFSAPVINEYGMCEAGIIAYQCPSGSMHCMDESYVLEILPVDGSDSGDIVVTELNNFAAPLIRYNTKDMAHRVPGPCPCGRGLSMISRVEGRAYDIIYSSRGTVVAGALLTHTMKRVPGVGKYQILQRDLTHIDVTYTEVSPLAAADRESIAATLRRHLGDDVSVTLARADDIAKERSGKHRWIKSLVTRESALEGGAR
jgi:phenylacetate-CoA ligase